MADRNRNLVVRVDDELLDMAHAVAEDRDAPVAHVVRTLLREAYRRRFGDRRPPSREGLAAAVVKR